VGQRIWLFFYAIASSIYRVIVGFAIMMLVYFQIPVLGVLMAVGGLVTWALVPVYKMTKYLALEPELHRKRTRAIAFSVTVAAAVIILVGLVRFPVNIDETGVIEPVNKAVMRAETSGFITRIGRHDDGRPLKDGDLVKKGQILWVAEDKALDAQVAQYQSQVDATLVQLRGARENDPLAMQVLGEKLAVWQKLLREAEKRRERLTVRAPIGGQLIAPDLHEMAGRHLREGQEAAVVADMNELEVVTLVEQRDSAQVISCVQKPDFKTEVRPAGRIEKILNGVGVQDRGATVYASHPGLTEQTGENIPLDKTDPQGHKLAVPQFELRVKLSPKDMDYIQTAGQKAYVRFKVGNQPLLEQWARRFWQLIQRENKTASWM
jgi:putative peptide zinc metalloprotease protein